MLSTIANHNLPQPAASGDHDKMSRTSASDPLEAAPFDEAAPSNGGLVYALPERPARAAAAVRAAASSSSSATTLPSGAQTQDNDLAEMARKMEQYRQVYAQRHQQLPEQPAYTGGGANVLLKNQQQTIPPPALAVSSAGTHLLPPWLAAQVTFNINSGPPPPTVPSFPTSFQHPHPGSSSTSAATFGSKQPSGLPVSLPSLHCSTPFPPSLPPSFPPVALPTSDMARSRAPQRAPRASRPRSADKYGRLHSTRSSKIYK